MTKQNIKYITIKEFRERGYLQELNRRFLHPLGMALEVTVNEEGTEVFSGVWDYRDDPEGLYYNLAESDNERLCSFREKLNTVNKEYKTKGMTREKTLGFTVEPIPKEQIQDES